ncbi:uncharacterized protein KY384_000153 [Bacidia gigantensis]|uniref:uncharacterized protein n=1 Tax=Bacidia gigantensis TaxID=2732470 RepID=UPI001D053391|nr:uncharacterized protein KY384_000153 [Bacidia gigantensis]KAG8526160.1 hypothetical protein KY384_000153 [Bacidia gigantensis]
MSPLAVQMDDSNREDFEKLENEWKEAKREARIEAEWNPVLSPAHRVPMDTSTPNRAVNGTAETSATMPAKAAAHGAQPGYGPHKRTTSSGLTVPLNA